MYNRMDDILREHEERLREERDKQRLAELQNPLLAYSITELKAEIRRRKGEKKAINSNRKNVTKF